MTSIVPSFAQYDINTFTQGAQFRSNIAALADGGFVVTWTSDGQDGDGFGVYAQRFGPDAQPAGAEFRVSDITEGEQYLGRVAGLSNGSFAIVWYEQDINGGDLSGRIYDASGNPGTTFTVNTYVDSTQNSPAITELDGGGFIVTWRSFFQDTAPLNATWDIYAQRFDATGAKVGGEFQVNTINDWQQTEPAVASFSDDSFVIVWQGRGDPNGGLSSTSFDVFMQRYAADGTPLGVETRVNTYTADTQYEADVAVLSGGTFVVTWISTGLGGSGVAQDGEGYGVFAQRYDASGNALGAEFQVNAQADSGGIETNVIGLADGGFMIAWMDSNGFPQGGYSGWDLVAQRFDVNGNRIGDEVKLHGPDTAGFAVDDQYEIDLALLENGGVAVSFGDGGRFQPSADIDGNVFGYTDILATEGDDTITTFGFGHRVEALGGADVMNGSDDVYGTDVLVGGDGHDLMFGNGGNDILIGGEGNDTYDGGAGTDTADFSDVSVNLIVDLAFAGAQTTGEGNDRFVSIENLIGGSGNDVIDGNAQANRLEGGDGTDELNGGRGADTLIGGEGADELNGSLGGDSLDGGAGDDTMAGGLDNDIYIIRDVGDVVIEMAGEGDDIADTYITWTMADHIEVLRMQGSDDLDATGTGSRDLIFGNDGENIINGGAGDDVMQGGMGNDTYAVDNSFDAVVEMAGEGFDNVYSSIDYIISETSEIESALITGTATVLRGSNSDNQLIGNDQVNVIDGRGGTDYMLGGLGNDIFQIGPEDGAVDIIGDFTNGGPGMGDRIAFTGFNEATSTVTQVSAVSFIIEDTSTGTSQQFQLFDAYGAAGYTGGELVAGEDYYFG